MMPEAQRGSSPHDPRNLIGDAVTPPAGDAGTRTAYVQTLAPPGKTVLDYDRDHLPLYAALLDAEDAGQDWRSVAARLMRIDVTDPGAETCWRSHLERARWIVGDGLAEAIAAFGTRPSRS